MKRNILITLLIVCIIVIGVSVFYYFNKSEEAIALDLKNQTITFESKDKLEITADLYMTENINAPFIILFHQAGYSRGEYLSIAPRLNELGFNCMAIDQRSGGTVKDVSNETFVRAINKGKDTSYEDAYIDLEATLQFVKKKIKPSKIIIWGSSYSASYAFPLAKNNAKDIDGILAFSPDDRFTFDEKPIFEYSKNLSCPVFITSAKSEKYDPLKIFESLKSDNKVSFVPKSDGIHGSSALWDSTLDNEEYWEAVENFLSTFDIK